MNVNVIELNEMIDLLNRFFHYSSEKHLVIGGIVGSHPLTYVLDTVTGFTTFDNVLILEGCADFAYIPKQFMNNYIPYQYILEDAYVEDINPPQPFVFDLWEKKLPTMKRVNRNFIKSFDVVIVNNAHLIEPQFRGMIGEAANMKCIFIGDPYDIGGEEFSYAPVITDCLEKQSAIVGMARNLYDVSTRMLDKRVPGDVKNGKISRRGIGKLDGKMYVSNNAKLVEAYQNEYRKIPFRKGQRFFVTDDRVQYVFEEDNKTKHVIYKNTMLQMQKATAVAQPNIMCLYHSKKSIKAYIEYDNKEKFPNERDYHILVKPANILTVDDARYHRYLDTVLIFTGELTRRQLYSVMKNSVNLTICDMKKGVF